MAKAASAKRGVRRRKANSLRRGWVRKNMAMDQRKLNVARRALGVRTETEAIDQALDLVIFREELTKGFAEIRKAGGIDDIFDSRRQA